MELEFLYNTEITIPLIQLVLLLVLSTMSLLFGKVKVALMINYVFSMYWGFFLNKELIFGIAQESEGLVMFYLGLGIGVAILAVIGFITHQKL